MDNNENKGKKSIWIWLLPLYILLLIPLIRWSIKLYSPEIQLSKDDLKSFSGEGKIKEDEYKTHEPDLEDITLAVNYKNQGSSLDSKDPYEDIVKSEDEESNKKADKESSNYKKRESKENNEDKEYGKQVEQAKKGQMMSVGYKQGFLTKTVGSIINNPKAIASLFNNSYVVNGFLNRETVKAALSDKQSLEYMLTKTDKVSNFLNNSVVKSALSNPEILNAIASSSLVNEILKSPAVNALLQDSNALNNIKAKNPQLTELINNPNIEKAIMNNPDIVGSFTQIQMNTK
jgi:hypothetical protein